jgi:hypothetical protein
VRQGGVQEALRCRHWFTILAEGNAKDLAPGSTASRGYLRQGLPHHANVSSNTGLSTNNETMTGNHTGVRKASPIPKHGANNTNFHNSVDIIRLRLQARQTISQAASGRIAWSSALSMCSMNTRRFSGTVRRHRMHWLASTWSFMKTGSPDTKTDQLLVHAGSGPNCTK